jgi:putative MATE family efflux protein
VTTSPTSLRRITALAVPALVVLAAEPLYLLVDTAVVGHLGATSLAALAIGGTLMTVAAWLGGVLAYGTTSRAARRFGAGDRAGAVAEGVQASWLALALGCTVAIAAWLFAGPLTAAMAGGDQEVAEAAAGWLRIASLGAPGLLLGTAGNGWLRGVQDLWRPLRYVVGANAISAVLCPVLVYPVGLGLTGSAIANATAQTLAGALFIRALMVERAPLAPVPAVLWRQLLLGRDLLVRGGAMHACFLSAAAVAARFGAAALAAHQIALQLWFFCALALDAVAIAAQSLVGAALGGGRADEARTLARRIGFAGLAGGGLFAAGIGAGVGVLPRLFSPDPQVYEQAVVAWPWFVATLPAAGLVYALDGVLLGAGDARYLRNLTLFATLAGFLPAIWIAHAFDLGLAGIWAGITLFIALRLIAQLARMRTGRWVVLGADRSA